MNEHELQLSLKELFGYQAFREGQLDIINASLARQDLVAILPTGSGKSLCFQLPALLDTGLTLVFSPLIALMQDQVNDLKSKGIESVAMINAAVDAPTRHEIYRQLAEQRIKLLYLAPERLRDDDFRNRISKANITRIVVDEAHCISHWGDSFRPDYFEIIKFAKSIKRPPISAFTATASPDTQSDIISNLELTKPKLFYRTIRRPELQIKVINCSGWDAKLTYLYNYLSKQKGTGIIYVARRVEGERLSISLRKLGFRAYHYHGGLDNFYRTKVSKAFLNGKLPIIVATRAFGLGINKANIRYVIHFDTPLSMETYIQEMGRAGRDGLDSDCILLFDPDDIMFQVRITGQRLLNKKILNQAKEYLNQNQKIGFTPIDIVALANNLDLSTVAVRILLNKLRDIQFLQLGSDLPLEIELVNGTWPFESDKELITTTEFENPQATLALIDEASNAGDMDYLVKSTAPSYSIINPNIELQLPELHHENEEIIAAARTRFQEFMKYSASKSCRYQQLESWMQEKPKPTCSSCDNCRHYESTLPIKISIPTIITFPLPHHRLRGYAGSPKTIVERGIIQKTDYGASLDQAFNNHKSLNALAEMVTSALKSSNYYKSCRSIACYPCIADKSNRLFGLTKLVAKKLNWEFVRDVSQLKGNRLVILIEEPEPYGLELFLRNKLASNLKHRVFSLTRGGIL